eukprot:COSAG02_NODE_1558_length_11928_cov_4.044974_4_plen_100_part_00
MAVVVAAAAPCRPLQAVGARCGGGCENFRDFSVRDLLGGLTDELCWAERTFDRFRCTRGLYAERAEQTGEGQRDGLGLPWLVDSLALLETPSAPWVQAS